MCLAVPGRVLDVSGDVWTERVGRVSFGGVVKEISLAYVPDVEPGQYVLVHVGFAISTIDDKEADRIFAVLEEMGALEELEDCAEPRPNLREAAG